MNPEQTKQFGVVEGKPLRISDLNIVALAEYLSENKIRTTQGKIIKPLHEAHQEIIADPARFKVLAAGRRFSKTLLAALTSLSVLMQINRRVWIVGPTYGHSEKVFREVYSILVNQMKIIQPGKQGKGRARFQKGDYYLETPWGSVLEAKSMEKPDSLAGDALDFVVIDEAALEPNLEDIWTQMVKPTLLDKEGSALFISTPRGKNDFYKLFTYGQLGLKQQKGLVEVIPQKGNKPSNDMRDWSAFRKTSYDNPLLASSPEKSKQEIDIAYREAVLSGKVVKFKQEYLADFEAVADSCFPGFIVEPTEEEQFGNIIDYKWHPNEGPVYAACDFNFAKPASTIFAQVNKFGDVIIFDESFTPHTNPHMQAQIILEKEKELNAVAEEIWRSEGVALQYRYRIEFSQVVADISGDQRQLTGRTAWDDFKDVLDRKPVGLKQARETGCNMIRQWLQYPLFDRYGEPLFTEAGEPKTAPKLFVNRSCTETIYALETARFKKGKDGTLKEDYEEDPRGYEGLIDALRYLLVYLFHDTGQHFTPIKGIQ